MEGLAGLFGRLIFGLAGDRFGAKPMLVVGLMIQALAAGAYFFTRQVDEFYAVAVVFGMSYAGVMPLYAVIAREYFPMRIMGTVFGAAAMVSSLGMALGPGARRLDLRSLRQLRLALCRLVRRRHRRRRHRAPLPAVPVAPAEGGATCLAIDSRVAVGKLRPG